MFPLVETVHVLGITLLAGTVAILDLRLLGLILRRERVSEIACRILPWTWRGLAVMLASGLLLFFAEAVKSYGNTAFRVKVVMLVLVGLNPLVFHTTIYRKVTDWDLAPVTPWRARLAGALSLTLWSGIIIAGRAMAYFQ